MSKAQFGIANGNYKHGKKHTRIYHIFLDMKQRCNNPKNSAYSNYGGRGIKVCREWLDDFMSFYNWSYEHGYNDTLTIDRIDCNKGYNPDNCRWVSITVQQRNRRSNRKITYKGRTLTLIEWAEELNMNYDMLRYRLDNWSSVEDCFEKPSQRKKLEK